MLKVEIPVKGYIRNYVESNYGKPVYFDRRTCIGKHFFALVGSCDTKYDKMYTGYSDVLVVNIQEDLFLRRGSVLTHTGIMDFNNFCEDIIKRELYVFVDALVETSGIKFKEAHRIYLEKFRMDDINFTFDNIKQSYYRYRRRQEAEGPVRVKC